MELKYDELMKEYNEVLKKYNMGLLTKEECIEQTEAIENELIAIECLSGNI